jgi:hypothetical protein
MGIAAQRCWRHHRMLADWSTSRGQARCTRSRACTQPVITSEDGQAVRVADKYMLHARHSAAMEGNRHWLNYWRVSAVTVHAPSERGGGGRQSQRGFAQAMRRTMHLPANDNLTGSHDGGVLRVRAQVRTAECIERSMNARLRRRDALRTVPHAALSGRTMSMLPCAI